MNGEVSGSAVVHTPFSAQAGVAQAQVALPQAITGKPPSAMRFANLPPTQGKVPVVVFLHGSSGINPTLGYDLWQEWLAKAGIASIIFDSMQLPDRLRYTSPVDAGIYEQIHALRHSEIHIVLEALAKTDWADMERLFLAGTSEGGVAVARYDGEAFLGKMIYSWSCEDNYFVESHDTSLKPIPVLNVMSKQDKYFTDENDYIDNDEATGNCATTFAESEEAEMAQVVLLPNAPHTLINLPATKSATLDFIRSLLNETV